MGMTETTDFAMPEVGEAYLRALKNFPEDPYSGQNTLGIHEVIKAHFLIADFFYQEGEGIGGIRPRDESLLHSALYRQHVGFGGVTKWTDVFDIAATLMFGIIKDHPFHDANKRTSFLSVLYYLYKKGFTPTIKSKEFEDFTVKISENRLKNFKSYKPLVKSGETEPEIIIISKYLKSNTRKIDARYYTVTYRQLNSLLKNYDCFLDNPSGNHIDVMKNIKKKRLYLKKLKRREVIEAHRVAQIGFPGWTKQVGKGAINTVRNKTKLTPENGIDSQAFFKGLEPMSELIAHYQNPLRSLAYR